MKLWIARHRRPSRGKTLIDQKEEINHNWLELQVRNFRRNEEKLQGKMLRRICPSVAIHCHFQVQATSCRRRNMGPLPVNLREEGLLSSTAEITKWNILSKQILMLDRRSQHVQLPPITLMALGSKQDWFSKCPSGSSCSNRSCKLTMRVGARRRGNLARTNWFRFFIGFTGKNALIFHFLILSKNKFIGWLVMFVRLSRAQILGSHENQKNLHPPVNVHLAGI